MSTEDGIEKWGFWADKQACWEIRRCVPDARELCMAYRDQSKPCWEQETLCEKFCGIETCFVCEVYERYGPAARRCGAGGCTEN